jgi:CRISPR-associated protein Csb1
MDESREEHMTTTAAENAVRILTLSDLQAAVSSGAAAFRCRRRLQPGGGEGDKVFPPTFMGAVYAVEQRRIPGHEQPVTCVLLDSVQSQANRMEQALQEALDAGEVLLPTVEVDFSEAALLEPLGKVTTLQVPHRLADAILRDSEHVGRPFRESEIAKVLDRATPLNATPLYRLCPTALVFGMWDSSGPKGGLGAKFERTIVSEAVGIDAEFGVRTASRIDPIITKTKGIVLYRTPDGRWTLDESKAVVEKSGNSRKPVKLGKDGKVSEANLGNVTPGFAKYTKNAEGPDPLKPGQAAREGQIAPGGVTVRYAEQVTTLSLICLRRLRFPVNGSKSDGPVDAAGRTVLSALGLCAATLAFEAGMGLRSRCLLWPDSPMQWELLATPGKPPESFTLDSAAAKQLLADAVSAAEKTGLVWQKERITLKPSAKLVDLVRLSQEQAVKPGVEEE